MAPIFFWCLIYRIVEDLSGRVPEDSYKGSAYYSELWNIFIIRAVDVRIVKYYLADGHQSWFTETFMVSQVHSLKYFSVYFRNIHTFYLNCLLSGHCIITELYKILYVQNVQFLKCFRNIFLGYANIKGTFHFIILQTLRKCYFFNVLQTFWNK